MKKRPAFEAVVEGTVETEDIEVLDIEESATPDSDDPRWWGAFWPASAKVCSEYCDRQADDHPPRESSGQSAVAPSSTITHSLHITKRAAHGRFDDRSGASRTARTPRTPRKARTRR